MEKLVNAVEWLEKNFPSNPKEGIYHEVGPGSNVIYQRQISTDCTPGKIPPRLAVGTLPEGWGFVCIPGEIPYPFTDDCGFFVGFVGPTYTCDLVRLLVDEYQAATEIIRSVLEV